MFTVHTPKKSTAPADTKDAAQTPEKPPAKPVKPKPSSTTPPWRADVLMPNKRFAQPSVTRVEPSNLTTINASLKSGEPAKALREPLPGDVPQLPPEDDSDDERWYRL